MADSQLRERRTCGSSGGSTSRSAALLGGPPGVRVAATFVAMALAFGLLVNDAHFSPLTADAVRVGALRVHVGMEAGRVVAGAARSSARL